MINAKVSVCIPTFNYARYLPDAINSVLEQTFYDFELLIIDNCSTDNTIELLKEYCARDKRIRFLVNESNVGAINNWSRCIAAAKGEYIKFLLSDDVLASENALKEMVAVLDANPLLSLVVSSRNRIDENLNIIKTYSPFRRGKIAGAQAIKRCFWHNKNLFGPLTTTMFRKNDVVNVFSTQYIALSDLEFCFRLLEKGDFYFIDDALCSIREHSGQGTYEAMKIPETYMDYGKLIKAYLHKTYLGINDFIKYEVRYNYWYSLWKTYKKGFLTFDRMKSEIGDNNYKYFVLLLPLYKCIRPLKKIVLKAL